MSSSGRPKLMVMGHGGHGKDTVCEILRDQYGFTFTSSSRAALSHAIWPAMAPYYDCLDDCFEDRRNWRDLWNQLIRRYTFDDPSLLAKRIFERSDIYCGIRSDVEFKAAWDDPLFDCAVWVDASKRLPPEPASSIQVTIDMADHVVDNNGTKEQLIDNVGGLVRAIW